MKKELLEWGKAIIIALIIAFFLRTFVFATSIVEGASMDPTLEDGERVIFNKIVYFVNEPDRGEIVIISRETKNYVKRVIGKPNDTVEYKNDTLFINGKAYEEDYLSESLQHETEAFGPVEVPEGKYFVMGDNRSISKDSRNGLGLIDADDIIGRSEFIIFPFDHISMTR
ncbi:MULTISPECIES: signal peptidase I [Allobacillus]|uniref:Signal peptidase I n=1 Tax=Allobacillus salarius TaxID=1955272 RepID=A0A556PLS3_9BACI|nr:signal peptidase I [Allobacillus salarius]TSJ65344.1 signal peptidase I [Allobacillus salarius]